MDRWIQTAVQVMRYFICFLRVTSNFSVKLRGRDSSQLRVSAICNKNNHSRGMHSVFIEWTKGGIRTARTTKEGRGDRGIVFATTSPSVHYAMDRNDKGRKGKRAKCTRRINFKNDKTNCLYISRWYTIRPSRFRTVSTFVEHQQHKKIIRKLSPTSIPCIY